MMVQLVRCNGELVLQPEDQLSHKIEHVWAGFQPDLLIENKTEIIFEERDPIVLPVSNNQRYYYVYEVEGKKYLLAERTIHIDGTFNMRDIGGYRTKDGRHVKWGRFIRSDALGKIDIDGLKMLSSMEVHTVVDFRNMQERSKAPDILDEKWQYMCLDPHADAAALASGTMRDDKQKIDHLLEIASTEDGRKKLDQKKTEMIEQYKEFVCGEESRKVYKEFIKICLGNENLPLIYHCRGGKDRTGFATLLILSMLGVPQKTINDDYMLTASNMAKRNEKRMNDYKQYTDNSYVLDYLNGLMLTKEEYINSAWQEIENSYKSVENYLQNVIDIDCNTIKSFQNDNLY